MSAVRSHVDPILFVRFMHFPDDETAVDVRELLEQEPSEDVFVEVWRRQSQYGFRTIFHEAYHFWQGVRLPYIYWHAMHCWRAATELFRSLATSGDDRATWESIMPAYYRMQMSVRCFRMPDGTMQLSPTGGAPDGAATEIRLSPLNLMEAAASIAEFQADNGAGAMSDPLTYSRWRKRNRSYDEIPIFVEETLEDPALALRVIVPLVNAAFHTTDPPRAFCYLLATLRANRHVAGFIEFFAQDEPCRWAEFFDHLFEQEEFEAEPDSTADVLDPPYCRLSLKPWVDGFSHPVLSHRAVQWAEHEARDPRYTWLIDQPAWAGEECFWEALNELGPPLTVVRFHGAERGVFTMQTSDFVLDPRELLAFWSVIRRANDINYNPAARICHHGECPEYEGNYCNAYPVIPQQYDQCGFPRRLNALIERYRTDHKQEDDV